MDHGDTFHCPLHHSPQKEHLPGVQSRDQSIITLQVTRMSLHCTVGAVTQVRGDSHGVRGRGGEPLGNGFRVRSHTSSSSSVTMPLASGQDASKETSCGVRNSPNRAGEEPTANSLHPSRAILFQHGGQFYREEGEHCWGGLREGDTGSLRLPSMVPSDPALAPHLQTPLSKTEGLPFF